MSRCRHRCSDCSDCYGSHSHVQQKNRRAQQRTICSRLVHRHENTNISNRASALSNSNGLFNAFTSASTELHVSVCLELLTRPECLFVARALNFQWALNFVVSCRVVGRKKKNNSKLKFDVWVRLKCRGPCARTENENTSVCFWWWWKIICGQKQRLDYTEQMDKLQTKKFRLLWWSVGVL